MVAHNLHYSQVKINDVYMVAMIFYTVDKGLKITEITVDGNEYKPDNATFVRLKQECKDDYFKTREIYAASDLRHNIKGK